MSEPTDRPYSHWTVEVEPQWFHTVALSPPPPRWEVFVEMWHGPMTSDPWYDTWRKLLLYKFDDYLEEVREVT